MKEKGTYRILKEGLECPPAFFLATPRSRKELREKGPPRVLQNLKDVVLIEGSAAKLECRISAFPDPFIRWSKDSVELKDGPKYRYIFEDPDIVALVVRDGCLSDLGKYTISVKNPFGECFDSARLLVEGNVAISPSLHGPTSFLNLATGIPWATKPFWGGSSFWECFSLAPLGKVILPVLFLQAAAPPGSIHSLMSFVGIKKKP